MSDVDGSVTQLRDMLNQARRVVVFTGAGISTESGIPDFRSPGGVWDRYKPIQFDDFIASHEARRESWRRKFATDAMMAAAVPNDGHKAVARLVSAGRVSAVITQNVDGLHQASGVDDNRVIELHGNATYAHCLSCGARFELAPLKIEFSKKETPPICDRCGGHIKTATISFGQAMPVAQMERAQFETLACDLFIAVGSSLVVYPAAGFLSMAKENGASLVIVNREGTGLDGMADLVINAGAGPVLSAAVRAETTPAG